MRISEFKPKPKAVPPDRVIELTESTTLADLFTLRRPSTKNNLVAQHQSLLYPFRDQCFANIHAFHVWLLRQKRPDVHNDLRGWSYRYLRNEVLLDVRADEHLSTDPLLGTGLEFINDYGDWDCTVYSNHYSDEREGRDKSYQLSARAMWSVCSALCYRVSSTLIRLETQGVDLGRTETFLKYAFEVFQSGKNLEYRPTTAPTFTFA